MPESDPTPVPIVHLDLSARLWMLSVKWLRYLHFITNVICIVLASIDQNSYIARRKTHSAAEKDQMTARIFFLFILTLLMITSLVLIVWRWTLFCKNPKHTTLLKPNYEVIYYAISGISLFVAGFVFLGSISLSEENSPYYKHAVAAVIFGALNVWMYFRSAWRLWILSNPQY